MQMNATNAQINSDYQHTNGEWCKLVDIFCLTVGKRATNS